MGGSRGGGGGGGGEDRGSGPQPPPEKSPKNPLHYFSEGSTKNVSYILIESVSVRGFNEYHTEK